MPDAETEAKLQHSFQPREWWHLSVTADDALTALTALEVVARLLARAHRRMADESPSTARELLQAAVDEINAAYESIVRSQDLSDHVVRAATQRVGEVMKGVNQRLGGEEA